MPFDNKTSCNVVWYLVLSFSFKFGIETFIPQIILLRGYGDAYGHMGCTYLRFLDQKKKSYQIVYFIFCYVQMVQILNEPVIMSFTLDNLWIF